jgi:hypothetical protein
LWRVRRAEPVLAAATCVAVAALAWANGAYFATAWAWAALAPLLVAGAALALTDRLPLEWLDATWSGALAALAAWVGLGALWSTSAAQPLLELERTLIYVATALAVLLAVCRRTAPALVVGTLVATALVAAYALATRLLPNRVGSFDSGAGYQLAEPIGYWNALGILAAMGLVLALGAAVAVSSALPRAAAAALLPLLACTLLFTFSRGAWLALGVALTVLVAFHPARARMAAVGLSLAPLPVLAVWLASRSDPLTEAGAELAAAERDGRRLALVLLALTALQAAVATVSTRLGPRVRVGRRERLVLAVAVAIASVAAASALVARVGTPIAALDRARDAFVAPLPQTGGDLSRRLFSVSGNGRSDYWDVALGLAADHPVLGAGARSYERRWLRERPTAFFARDAHNLYLETLAELGPLGLAFLLTALTTPLIALVRARREPLAPAAGAAYCAFLAHAALDWDWELPAVAVPALVLAGVLVVLARRRPAAVPLGRRARAGGLAALGVAAAFLFVMHAGNTALAESAAALERGDVDRAAREARSARRWQPWSFEPWQRLAEAQLAAGDARAARGSYGEAIERDPENWSLWYGLATASDGAAREHALDRAIALNPRIPDADKLLGNG